MKHQDLTGHQGDLLERLMKTIETLETATFILKRIETQIESGQTDMSMIQLRFEGARLVVKQAELTLAGLSGRKETAQLRRPERPARAAAPQPSYRPVKRPSIYDRANELAEADKVKAGPTEDPVE